MQVSGVQAARNHSLCLSLNVERTHWEPKGQGQYEAGDTGAVNTGLHNHVTQGSNAANMKIVISRI